MRKLLAAIVVASSLLLALGLAGLASAQEPLTINTAGLTRTNGVCDLGTGNVGTFLNLAIPPAAARDRRPSPGRWSAASFRLG
jgi:hypothetical protein